MGRPGRKASGASKRRQKTREGQGRATGLNPRTENIRRASVPIGGDPILGATALGRMVEWNCLRCSLPGIAKPEELHQAGEYYGAAHSFVFQSPHVRNGVLARYFPSSSTPETSEIQGIRIRERYDRFDNSLRRLGGEAVRITQQICLNDEDPAWLKRWQRHSMTPSDTHQRILLIRALDKFWQAIQRR